MARVLFTFGLAGLHLDMVVFNVGAVALRLAWVSLYSVGEGNGTFGLVGLHPARALFTFGLVALQLIWVLFNFGQDIVYSWLGWSTCG